MPLMGIFDIFHEEAKVPAARSDSDSNDAPAGGAITTALEAIWLEKETPSHVTPVGLSCS